MVFKMISRHWQTQVNGNSAANASLIQHVRRYGNQITLLESKSFSMILPASIFYPHPVWGPLLHLLLLFYFFVTPCPDPAQTWAGVDKGWCLPIPSRLSRVSREVLQSFWEAGSGNEGSLPCGPKEWAARLKSPWKWKMWTLCFFYSASHLTVCAPG